MCRENCDGYKLTVLMGCLGSAILIPGATDTQVLRGCKKGKSRKSSQIRGCALLSVSPGAETVKGFKERLPRLYRGRVEFRCKAQEPHDHGGESSCTFQLQVPQADTIPPETAPFESGTGGITASDQFCARGQASVAVPRTCRGKSCRQTSHTGSASYRLQYHSLQLDI